MSTSSTQREIRLRIRQIVTREPLSRAGHLTTVGKLFREARDKAGPPKEFGLVLQPARLRVLRETGNLAAVMKTMGHKDVRTTMRYQHPELDIVRDALNATQTMMVQ